MPDPVRIDGLPEFRKALKKLDGDLPRVLRDGMKTIAEKVAASTRASFGGRGGVAPKVAASVRASGQQTGAAVKIGGNAYPYALGAEFGATRFNQFPAWRGAGDGAGYSLYPAIRAARATIVDDADQLLQRIAREAFPN